MKLMATVFVNALKARPAVSCLILVVAMITLRSAAFAADAEVGQVELIAGQSKTVRTDYLLGNVMVANPKVADLHRADHEVAIIGKGPGSTDVTLWDQQGVKRQELKVHVSKDLSESAAQLRALIGDIEGVTVRVVGSTISIDGEVLREDDIARIEKIAATFQPVVNQIKLNPRAMVIMAEKIQQDIGTRGVSARVINGKIFLEGIVYNKAVAEKAEKIALAYTPQIVNTIEVREPPPRQEPPQDTRTVAVKATFSEISRSAIDSLGIQWAPGISVDGTGSGSFGSGQSTWVGSIVGTISSFFPKFRAAAENGHARIIEEPTVITRSGEKGEFFSGGEIALPIVQADGGRTNEWKQFGVTLNIEPKVRDDNTIDLKIEVEVSSLSRLSGNIPGLSKSKIKTTLTIKSNESVVLGGLLNSSDRKIANKVPEGASSGALWQLYRSKDFQEEKSEMVLFVTPIILDSPAQAGKDLRKQVEDGFKALDPGTGKLR